jgi:hypothetical protein
MSRDYDLKLLCIWRRMSSLMIPGLTCVGSSYVGAPPLHDCSPCSWLDGVVFHPSTYSCSSLGYSGCSPPHIHGGGDKVKVEVTLRLTVRQSVSLGVEPHMGLMTRYLLLFDSYGLVFVRRPLWREDGSVFYICWWILASVVFLGSESRGTRDQIFFAVSDLRLPFSSPPTTRKVKVKVTVRLAVYRQSICLGVKPLETHDQNTICYSQLNPFDISPYVTSSLTRRWVCLLWICLAFRQVYISHI